MKPGIFAAGIMIVSLSMYALGTLIDHKVLAQPIAVELSIPRTWGRVVGVVGMNILFESPDGNIREVSLVGGQATVVTLLTRK